MVELARWHLSLHIEALLHANNALSKKAFRNCRSFEQPSTFLEAWCRSSGMIVSYKWQGECRFHHFDWYSDVWTNFWPLQKFKTSHVLSARIFIREEGRLGVAIQNGGKTNFETKSVGYPTKKISTQKFFVIGYSVLCQRKRMWIQKNIVFGMEWTWVTSSLWDFSEAKHKSRKPLINQCYVSC